MGDFNDVRRVNEKSEGSSVADDFNLCLEDIDMEELTSKGFWFTWSNKRRGEANIRS